LDIGQFIASLPFWLILSGVMTINLVSIYAGMLLARHRTRRAGPDVQEDSTAAGTVASAMAGLLAFILAFTFGTATDRFFQKNDLLLQEVQAIETTFLKAGLVPEPYRSETRNLLKDYVGLRLEMQQAGSMEEARAIIQKSEDLKKKLWAGAEGLSREKLDNPDIVSLFVDSLGGMLEIQTQRVTVALIRRGVLPVMWNMLIALLILSSALFGYYFGISLPRRSDFLPIFILSLAFSCVFVVIASYDREIGVNRLSKINQQPMIELYQRIEARME